MRLVLLVLLGLLALSCNKNNEEGDVKMRNGEVWLSGGLYYCAEQIHLDNGETLIVTMEEVYPYVSGDRVRVKYIETGINESCAPGIDCEIMELKKL